MTDLTKMSPEQLKALLAESLREADAIMDELGRRGEEEFRRFTELKRSGPTQQEKANAEIAALLVRTKSL